MSREDTVEGASPGLVEVGLVLKEEVDDEGGDSRQRERCHELEERRRKLVAGAQRGHAESSA
jgi:hypothetical protein